MERFETESRALIPGQRVRATVLSRHPLGVIVRTAGHEGVGASVDVIEQLGRTTSSVLRRGAVGEAPPVGDDEGERARAVSIGRTA